MIEKVQQLIDATSAIEFASNKIKEMEREVLSELQKNEDYLKMKEIVLSMGQIIESLRAEILKETQETGEV
jgi:hypothetical protein